MKKILVSATLFLFLSLTSIFLHRIFLPKVSKQIVPSSSSSYILIGDAGTGASQQYEIANAIKSYCHASKDCKAVFILGDVIYDEGVKTSDDEQFTSKFEEPYKEINLPFYILFGNHDYLGCTKCYLEYDKVSSKWEMPARYYSQKFDLISFYVIDTENFDRDQQKWLSNEFSTNKSGWKMVLGHRPIKTFEETKLGENWKGKVELKEIICNNADFYISGHSHILEDPGEIKECKVKQLISGSGGSYTRKVKKPYEYEGEFYFEDNGFLVLTTSKNAMKFEFFDKTGNSLYNIEIGQHNSL